MTNGNLAPTGSVFYNLVYWSVKLRAGFIALILVLATVFIYQYWQDLNQSPLSVVAKVQTDYLISTLNMPEKLIYDDGIMADIKLLTKSTGKSFLDSDNVIIELASDNPNITFDPSEIVLSKLELEKNENSYSVKLSSKSSLQGEKININVTVKNPNKTEISIQKTVSVEDKSKKPLVFISGLLSFITAILSFIIQIRNFVSK
jgi:hypothetical protein